LCTSIVSLGVVRVVLERNSAVDDDLAVVFVFEVDEGAIAMKFS
jgi:hypothetical protein